MAQLGRAAEDCPATGAGLGSRGKWLDGTGMQGSRDDAGPPVKAKPQSRPVQPADSPSPVPTKPGGAWDAFCRAPRLQECTPQEVKASSDADPGSASNCAGAGSDYGASSERQAAPRRFGFGNRSFRGDERNGFARDDRGGAFGAGGRRGGFFHGDRQGGDQFSDLSPDDERISHCLGRILRYRVGEYSLEMDDDGYIPVPALLALQELRGACLEDLRRVVEESFGTRGKRFELRERETPEGQTVAEVRALYRHPQDTRPPPRWGGGRRRRFFDDGPDFGRRGGDMFHGPRGGYGAAPRKGFSQSPPVDESQEGQEVSSSSKPSLFKMSPRGTGSEHYDIEDEFAALASTPGAASRVAETEHDEDEASKSRGAGASSGASASTAASSADAKEEVWERYLEPGTLKAWFWNPSTDEVLWADDPDPSWQLFFTESGKRWWWQESTGRYFFEADAAE